MQNNTALVNVEPKEAPLQLPEETAFLIKASIAENTQKAYQRALQSLETWLSGRTLSDALLANYITSLHEAGKSPATIGQAVAAVKWQLKHQSETVNFPITQATLAGIRREGKDRGRGQVDGLIWQDAERVCIYAETEGTLAGLRDAAMIRLMSDCLLCISEVVAVNVGDLKEKTLTIQSSKTDQEGTGESLYVCDATRGVLERYGERAGIARGTLFRHIPPRRPHPAAATHTPLRTPYHSKTRASRRCGRFHLRALPARRFCRLARPSWCICRRYASRRSMEILTNASTLRKSRISRTGRNRTIQRWKAIIQIHTAEKNTDQTYDAQVIRTVL